MVGSIDTGFRRFDPRSYPLPNSNLLSGASAANLIQNARRLTREQSKLLFIGRAKLQNFPGIIQLIPENIGLTHITAFS